MKAFFDHNLSPFMARAINVVVDPDGSSAICKRDKFSPKTADTEWISTLGREGGWTIFSGDMKILKNPVERNAYFAANLTGFFLRPAVCKLPVLQQTATILWHWHAIDQLVSLQERGAYWLPLNKTAKYRAIRF